MEGKGSVLLPMHGKKAGFQLSRDAESEDGEEGSSRGRDHL